MASRKKEVAFAIQRFKGFWNQYKQSKRGVLGIIIILIFGITAIFAPIITPLDPMRPKWPGHFPGSEQPKLAAKLAVPIWYRSLLGMQDLSENMQVVDDQEFQSEEVFNTQWEWAMDKPQYGVSVEYSSTRGENDNDGCIRMSYQREASQVPPEDGQISVTLSKPFEFPFQGNPKSFYWHQSIYVENKTFLVAFPVEITVEFRRGDEPGSFFASKIAFPITQLFDENGTSKWYSKAGTSLGDQGTLEEEIFTGAGNYTLDFTITIIDQDAAGNADITVYVDNLQMILYGQAFGLLGTSSLPEASPRDLFTMLVYGTRISFMIGILTAIFSVLIGLAVGLVSGYMRGLVDEGLMRFADFLLVLPGLPLLIVLVTVLGRSIWNIIGVMIFMGWMGFSRSVRSMVLSLRERPFIESARAAGGGTFYVIYRHILPNVFALVYISLATSVPGAIISEASLAWLGLGDINIPSWGIMLYDFSRTQTAIIKGLGEYWFWVIPPGFAIAVMAMAFILMGFSLDEILNPRLRERR